MPDHDVDVPRFKPTSIADFECLIGAERVDRILSKARQLSDLRIVNVSSTYYGPFRPHGLRLIPETWVTLGPCPVIANRPRS
jgi:hypothetical protein